MNLQFDIIIPSRPNMDNLHRLLASINKQDCKAQNIYIIIDKKITNEEYNYYQDPTQGLCNLANIKLLTNINTNFEAGKGVSYVRNFGIKVCQSEYILILDDDTELSENFISSLVNKHISIEQNTQKSFVLFPTIKYQNTDKIQTQGYNMIHYWMMRPEPVYSNNDLKTEIWKKLFGRLELQDIKSDNSAGINKSGNLKHIYCCPSICLFGKTDIFKKNLYDERMKFVYEDLDMSARLTKKGIEIYNLTDIYIAHFESVRTKLQASFLTPEQAYNKSKNRILFVKNNADRSEKLLFYFIGLAGQTLWFTIFIIIYGERRIYTLGQIFMGIKDGILSSQYIDKQYKMNI